MNHLEISLSAKCMNMRTFIKYISLSFFCLFLSCQKQTPSSGIFSEGGLISFSACVETKTPIITELNGKQFGVYGYNFSNLTNWTTYRTSATPNVFHNLEVECSEVDGSCSYDYTPAQGEEETIGGRKQWELNKRYSYFAYYPYNTTVNSLTPSGASIMNTPYVEYLLPALSSDNPDDIIFVDPDDLLDIMTAQVTEYSATQGTTVRFSFNHRLFCIDLYGQNFNATDIKISDLSITISGIHYNKTLIYMDNEIASKPDKTEDWDTSKTITFPIISGTESTIVAANGDAASLTGDNVIVLIPQDSSVKNVPGLSVEIKFKMNDGSEHLIRSATYQVNFQENKKYSITLNFIGNDVVMVAADAAAWEKKVVTHTFD